MRFCIHLVTVLSALHLVHTHSATGHQQLGQDSGGSSEEKSTTTARDAKTTNPPLLSRSVSCSTRAGTPKALQTNEDMIQILKDKGGSFLPKYMAVDAQSAALQFPNLLTMTNSYQEFVLHHFNAVSDNDITKQTLMDALQKMDFQNTSDSYHYQFVPYRRHDDHVDRYRGLFQRLRRLKRQVMATDPITKLEYCETRGTETDDGYLPMCTTCAATTTLPEDKFPRIINEVVCSDTDRGCLTVSGTSHGYCKQKVFNLNMLRKKDNCTASIENGQTVVSDDWELYTQPIRVCCECLIDKRSIFANYIGPGI